MVNYSQICFYLFIAMVVSVILVMLSKFLSVKELNLEKVGVYECGFDPFDDCRRPFSIRFFLIGILFIVFDLEVLFLFPWSIILNIISWEGYIAMFVFLILLIIGLVYEWVKGGLEWL
uniref:NADH-ubiquinone oxidoreductase chain 3 n=1 Tax=Sphaerothecum destruens TaxID=42893 RepID=A0A6H2U2X0_9EUKA|nr:NADH dehydrogenase subunit 3 [Sphaerothecum destruens]QID02687.1 NADH dehydrogenase subunit 3 [Sphaerothecum destruens]